MSFDDKTILTICEGLRLGLARKPACGRASVPHTTFLSWMTMEGEPYTTIQQLVRKAENDFQFRHAANLTLASRQQPQISEWLLSHARSSRADWRQYQQALIDAQGATFNIATILTQVEERRKQRAIAARAIRPIR